jgi:hypothetical protein
VPLGVGVWLPVRDVGLRLDVNDHAWWPKSVGTLIAETTLIGALTAVAAWAGGGRVRAGRVHPLTEWLSGSCRSAVAVDCGVEQRVAPCSSDEQVASHPALVFQASLLQHTS